MNSNLLGKIGILGVATLLTVPALSGCETKTGDEAGDSTETSSGDGDGDATGDGDGDPATGDGDGDATGDGDGDATGDGDGDQTGDGDGDMGGACDSTHTPGDGAADGEACATNLDCASMVCEVFQDAPPGDGVCAPITADCETRIMGTVLDFVNREPVPLAELRVAQAIQASLDPVNAAGLAVGTADDKGAIDTLSDGQIESPLGIVGLVEAEGYTLTATGLASPVDGNLYGPANTIHDIWAVPTSSLDEWSGFLQLDPDFTNFLPLGEAGGVVGFVRDPATGDPVAGAVVVPTDADGSSAKIRFLNEAGDGFDGAETGSSGVFVIVDPGLGETFDVEIGGESQGLSGTAGSANDAIFTLIMNVTPP